ncbi:Isoleucine--tRNA ligase, cytoplasmic [Halocaridina rubra]|uniref:Insulin receptor substrate 1 n=1 Tax=Halocaridina rubra TaxID=373956 RepID=A0AAN9AH54_HALRR
MFLQKARRRQGTTLLKKVLNKTMKKKFFVLRRDTGPDSPARLEYFDSERKFKSGVLPKKPIILRSCFSINKKKDPRHNHVIALYSNPDSFSVAAESEAELNEWLKFLKLHMHQAVADGDDQSRKLYEHVWLVVIQNRGLGSSKNMTGEYHICLTYKSIALVRVGDGQNKIEFPLTTIRRCGHTGSFFFLCLGRSAVTGAGDMWMLTEDAVIAENMHSIIKKAMYDPLNNMSEEPVSRERTQSMSNHRSFEGTTPCHPRSRCGSMPSRSRTSSEGSVQAAPNKLPPPNCSHPLDRSGPCCLHAMTRPKSMYSSSLSSSCSQPFASALFSPSSSESVESAASVDEFDGLYSRTPDSFETLGKGDESIYMAMEGTECGSSSHGREHLQPPFYLPINTCSIHDSLSKGLVSPGSGSSTEGPCLLSPQEIYTEMASPLTERISIGVSGSQSDRGGYLLMDPLSHQSQGTSGSEISVYMPMAMLNSPGSSFPSWPLHSTSSQVSSPPHSANHSRFNSLVDDSYDSYPPVVPGGHLNEGLSSSGDSCSHDRGGYFEFTPTPAIPLPCSPSDGDSITEMSPGSSCSFTSGTPSSDHRFPDYIAEKNGSGYSEDDDSSIERPIRTNSVGSKPEQFRSRKNSAPILGSSPISNSWSGTPGIFFRGFHQNRSQERSDLMELDFSKDKSCDNISADKEKKSSSIESIRRTLTAHRHRSNSKSSGNGKSSLFETTKRDKKKSESEVSSKSIEIPNMDYVEFSPSPRRNMEADDGYLPMKASISLSQSSSTEYQVMTNRDHSSNSSYNQSFADSSTDLSRSSDRLGSLYTTALTPDGYVVMSQDKGIGPSTPVSSSPSTTSNNSSSIGARVRKFSSTFIPMSSQDFSPQMDEYMAVDLRSSADSSSHSHDGEKGRKKEKKSIKRKSFKESNKRKKSDPIAVVGKGDDDGNRKGSSSLSHWPTFLGRKNSSGTPPKTPLSPTGSPLPKSSRGTPSPFSSLTRNKSRDKDNSKDSASKESAGVTNIGSSIGTSCIEESSKETEESAIASTTADASSSTQIVPSNSEQTGKSINKRSSGVFESSQVSDVKTEEIHLTSRASAVLSHHKKSESSSLEMGAYVNLALGSASSEKNLHVESKHRKVSTGSLSADYMNISPVTTTKTLESEKQQPGLQEQSHQHDYVNMCPVGQKTDTTTNSTLPTLQPCASNTGSILSSSRSSDNVKSEFSKKSPSLGYSSIREQNRRESKRLSGGNGNEDGDGESDYLLMTRGQPPPKPTSPRVVTRRPDIPSTLLGSRHDGSLTATLERLNLGGSERCRSHSGPGAPEGSAVCGDARVKKQLSEPRVGSGGQGNGGRAASACSSPVSYSPPTSPTLGGSVSSVSSLSEGGLSSASSTCTVVNVGVGRRESGVGAGGRLQDAQADAASSSSQQSGSTVSDSSGESGLNYVSLDLGPARNEGIMPSPRASRRNASGNSTQTHGTGTQESSTVGEEDYSLSYAQIDFKKSEGLRTTSLSRDHRH